MHSIVCVHCQLSLRSFNHRQRERERASKKARPAPVFFDSFLDFLTLGSALEICHLWGAPSGTELIGRVSENSLLQHQLDFVFILGIFHNIHSIFCKVLLAAAAKTAAPY